MGELGVRLKQARQARGVSLREIATTTKISVVTLEALERSDYSRLPGGIFSRSFVRAYALAVGLDPDDTVHEFLTEYERYEREAEHSAKRPEITPDDRVFIEKQRQALRTLRLVLILLAIVALGALAYVTLVWWPAQTAPAASSAPGAFASPSSHLGPLGSHLG